MKNFALYEKLNDLADYLFPVVDNFPKREKFTLCTQIKNCVHGMIRHTVRAQKSKDKLRWLFEVDVELEVLRHFIRHAFSLRYFSARRLKIITGHVAEVGRITGGLIKRFRG